MPIKIPETKDAGAFNKPRHPIPLMSFLLCHPDVVHFRRLPFDRAGRQSLLLFGIQTLFFDICQKLLLSLAV